MSDHAYGMIQIKDFTMAMLHFCRVLSFHVTQLVGILTSLGSATFVKYLYLTLLIIKHLVKVKHHVKLSRIVHRIVQVS